MTLPLQGRGPLRVVLVDDTPDIRLLLRAALEGGGGFEVVGAAGDGAAGVEVVAATRPDLVLVDLAMPVLDGLEALPALRRACPSAHLVVFSGFGSAAVEARTRAAGADAYLQKGLAPEDLRARLLAIARSTPPPAGPAPAPRPPAAAGHGVPDDTAWLRSAIAGAVHEIRNPTVVIAGAVAALRGAAAAPGPLREDLLDALARQARLLDRATADLLAAAQAHRGGLRVDVRPVVLADVLAAAVADAAPADAGHEGVVALDCPGDLVVAADPLRVQQMIHNLVGNAVKYGAPPVRVQARRDAGGVRVEVCDAGPGVPADAVETIFDEFTRAPGSGARGTGLGLFVVRSLAAAQGGTAWYGAAPGGGAVFAFTLPTADAAPFQPGEAAGAGAR